MGHKSTQAEKLNRVKLVYTLLVNGLKRRDILQYATETDWNVSERTLDEYIACATKIVREQAKEDVEYMRAMSLTRHDDLYSKCAQINDFKTCLAIQRSRDEITGVKTNKIEIGGLPNGSPINIRTEDLVQTEEFKNRLEELFELRKQRYKK